VYFLIFKKKSFFVSYFLLLYIKTTGEKLHSFSSQSQKACYVVFTKKFLWVHWLKLYLDRQHLMLLAAGCSVGTGIVILY